MTRSNDKKHNEGRKSKSPFFYFEYHLALQKIQELTFDIIIFLVPNLPHKTIINSCTLSSNSEGSGTVVATYNQV